MSEITENQENYEQKYHDLLLNYQLFCSALTQTLAYHLEKYENKQALEAAERLEKLLSDPSVPQEITAIKMRISYAIDDLKIKINSKE